jgi:hypothetical protein
MGWFINYCFYVELKLSLCRNPEIIELANVSSEGVTTSNRLGRQSIV